VRIGAPEESLPGERRVAVTPASIKKLRDLGHEVVVEHGAGHHSGIEDEEYASAGAALVSRDEAFAAEIVLKVRPPTLAEVERMKEGAVLVSLIQPERNPELLEALVRRKISAVALERVPRITRAQKMDVLSSMANAAGYRAVIAAAEHYQGFFGPQVTAAGTTPPAKALIIGAGVAGLAAIAAAKALGAEVRAFDTRAAAREQVESLGATFLQVEIEESGDGGGGYAKEMSKEFIEAEMKLFRKQAEDVTIVVTTALVPGKKAPTLLPRDVAEAFKPGTVIVDMAAEQGGNCELTLPGEVVQHQGITIVGWTDLPSRMARVTSKFFAANVAALLAEMGSGAAFRIDLESEVIRPALLAHAGEALPPPPRKDPAPAEAKRSNKPPPPDAKPKQEHITSPTRRAWGTTLAGMAMIGLLFVLGRFAPAAFLQHFTVFILACFVGWQVIWSVTPALHTPLMSVTNAISGIIVVGGMLQIGQGLDLASILGALAVLFAAINVAGGFLVTQRMLRMFRRDGPPSDAGPPSDTGHGGHR
jgi:NAD(P) transhydrogenase subunit alpha